MIPWLTNALFAVLDRADRTVADACHAVRAGFAPNRLAVFECDVVHRTTLCALTTADTGVRYGESIRIHKEFVSDSICLFISKRTYVPQAVSLSE